MIKQRGYQYSTGRLNSKFLPLLCIHNGDARIEPLRVL